MTQGYLKKISYVALKKKSGRFLNAVLVLLILKYLFSYFIFIFALLWKNTYVKSSAKNIKNENKICKTIFRLQYCMSKRKGEKLFFTSLGKVVLWHLLGQDDLGGLDFYS